MYLKLDANVASSPSLASQILWRESDPKITIVQLLPSVSLIFLLNNHSNSRLFVDIASSQSRTY